MVWTTFAAAVLMAACSVCLAGEPVAKADFCVAPAGADTNGGTPDRPFATLRRARDAVRERVAAGLKAPVLVILRGGTYELAETLVFGPQDSGTQEFSVTYAAAPGEDVLVSGGRKIAGWRRGQGGLWTAEVAGVKEGRWYFRQLFVDGRRAVRARTPNKDDAAPYLQLAGATLSSDLRKHVYQFAPGQLKAWRNLGDVEAVVFGNWEVTRKRFAKVDPATGAAEMAGPHAAPHEAMAPAAGRWFYLENAVEMLDRPGEWYLDRQSGIVTYWPLPGEDMAKATVAAPALARLVDIAGKPGSPVRNVHFRGIRFEHADWSPPPGGYLGIQACHFVTGASYTETGYDKVWGLIGAAIRWEGAEGCSIEDGQIARLGGCGIELANRCRACAVRGNRIFDVSGSGVQVGGPKDEAQVPRAVRIEDNHVRSCGIDYHGAVGVWVGFAKGIAVSHNLVHDLPYTGISVGWQWNPEPTPVRNNIIEYNHIYDVMNRLGDGGGIYTLGLQPGTVIRGNHIHDVHRSKYAQAAPNNGMFIDEGSKGFLFERNVIYRTSAEPVRFNQCSRDWHTWRDNSFGPAPDAPEARTGPAAGVIKDTIEKAGLEPAYRARLSGDAG
jgi:hypothetical protein